MGSELSFFFWRLPLTTFRERELEKRLRNLNLPFCVAESGFLRWPTCRPPAKIWCSACASRSYGWVQTGAQGVSRRPDPSRRRRSPRRFTMPDCRLFGNTNLRTRAGTTSFQLQARLWDIICIVSLILCPTCKWELIFFVVTLLYLLLLLSLILGLYDKWKGY